MKKIENLLFITWFIITRLFVWSILVLTFIWIITMPITHWIPIVSHIFITIYILIWILILSYIWDNFIKDVKKAEKRQKINLTK